MIIPYISIWLYLTVYFRKSFPKISTNHIIKGRVFEFDCCPYVECWDIVCWGCVMLEMWDGRDVGCSGCGMLGMWDVGDVGCWGCGMFWIWDVGCGMFTGMWNVDLQNVEVVLVSSLLILNYFTPSPSFSIFDFEQVNICWESYLIFYSFDICSNVSMRGRQDLARSNTGNSIVFLISNLEWDVTLAANLRLLKWFIQGIPESLYKCDHQILGTQK